MNLCKTCGTICPFDDERTECDAYAPMTNENWFISLPTEEKAEWLDKVLMCCNNHDCLSCPMGGKPHCDKKGIEEWLKAPHKGYKKE